MTISVDNLYESVETLLCHLKIEFVFFFGGGDVNI